MKLNKDQYEAVYALANRAEELAERIDTTVDSVIEVVATASGWLENYAEKLRTEADRNVAGTEWEQATDDVQDAVDYKIDITGQTPSEIVKTVSDLLNQHYNEHKTEGIASVDDLIKNIFKDRPGTDENNPS